MKVILTGCAGFIGSNIAKRLIDNGHEVYGYDNLSFGYEKNVPTGVNFYPTRSLSIPKEIIDAADVIVDAATHNLIYAMNNPMHVIFNNAVDAMIFFDRIPKEKKIIYFGTSSIYGNAEEIPTPETAKIDLSNGYDTSKFIAELFLKSRGNVTVLRLTNTYGPNQHPCHEYSGVIGKMIGQALNKQPIEVIGSALQTRDFTYVGDVVDATMLAIEQPAKNCAINIGTGIETSILDLTKIIKEQVPDQSGFTIKEIPARAIDKITRRCLLIERAKYELGWVPKTRLLTGIKQTIDWQLSEYHNK